jgi:hypothetical protein
MSLPYMFWRSLQDSRALPQNLELEVSLSLADGTPLKFSNTGKLTPVSAQADKTLYILQGAAQTNSVGTLVNFGATPIILNQIGNGYNAQAGPGGNQQVQQLGGYADVIPAQNGMGIWRTSFVPILSNLVGNTTGSPTSVSINVAAATSYNAHDFRGGTLYCKSLNQQVQITDSAACAGSGAALVLTIAAPLGQPGATINADGLVFSATPLGKGMSAVKYQSLSSVAADGYVPSQVIADLSGGYIGIQEVDIQNGFVFVTFQ